MLNKKALVKYIKAFLIFLGCAMALLFLVSLIPNDLILKNVINSQQIAYPNFAHALDFSKLADILDKPTEALMLNRTLLDGNRFLSIMDSQDYARYWHGYLIVLRPLLVFTDITGIYFVNMFIYPVQEEGGDNELGG